MEENENVLFTDNNVQTGKKVSIRGQKKGNADCSTLPAT
jgi:hypothetical protein